MAKKNLYINHITINTGHCRKTYPSEISKDIYMTLFRIFRDAQAPNGCDIMENEFNVKITGDKIGYLCTLFKYDSGCKVPVLTSAYSKVDKDGELWDMLFQNMTAPLLVERPEMPELPYIADRIEMGMGLFPGVSSFTGDFSRCMGWISLYPEKIK